MYRSIHKFLKTLKHFKLYAFACSNLARNLSKFRVICKKKMKLRTFESKKHNPGKYCSTKLSTRKIKYQYALNKSHRVFT